MDTSLTFTSPEAGNTVHSRLLWAAQWITILSLPLMFVGVAGMEVATALVGLLFLAHSSITREWGWLRQGWVAVAMLLWAYMCARSLFTPEWQSALTRSAVWIRYPVFAAALAFWVLRNRIVQVRLLRSLLLVLAFLIIDTWIQYSTGTDLLGRALIRSAEQVRLTGPFSNPRVGITMAWIMFPALAVLLAREISLCLHRAPTLCPLRRTGLYVLAIASVVGAITAVYIAGERMALLFSLLGLCICFIAISRARVTLLAAAVVGALVIAGITAQNPALKSRQIEESSKEITSFWESPYGKLWRTSLRMVEDNPLFGIGPKHFRTVCHHPRYSIVEDLSDSAPCLLHPHNIYMEWLAETGLIGFGVFVALITHWLIALWNERRAVFTDPLLAGLVAALAIRLWPLSSTTSQFSGWSAGPFWLMTGWLLARLAWHEASRLRKE